MRHVDLSLTSVAALAFASNVASAALPVPSGPASPVPPTPGTGLDSEWNQEPDPSLFQSIDNALPLLTLPLTIALPGVGPVSISNFILPIGDFSVHSPMPFSATGHPAGTGEYVVGRMVGTWAARAAGTYTIAVGSDDGFRLTLGTTRLLNFPLPQSFSRAAASFEIAEAGLYVLEVDYFNSIEEGAIEVSIAPGEIALASPSESVPAAFALIPKIDLYPLNAPDSGVGDSGIDDASVAPDGALAAGDAAVPIMDAAAPCDASGPPDAGASPDDAAVGPDAGVPGATGHADDAGVDDSWHGGGCQVAQSDGPASLLALVGAALTLAALRRRRTSARVFGRR